jgi:hypothetical protein
MDLGSVAAQGQVPKTGFGVMGFDAGICGVIGWTMVVISCWELYSEKMFDTSQPTKSSRRKVCNWYLRTFYSAHRSSRTVVSNVTVDNIILWNTVLDAFQAQGDYEAGMVLPSDEICLYQPRF